MRLSLEEYLNQLSWSQTDLAREAEISVTVVRRVLAGQSISRRNAKKIVQTLDQQFHALGEVNEHMTLASIENIHISDLYRRKRGEEITEIDDTQ